MTSENAPEQLSKLPELWESNALNPISRISGETVESQIHHIFGVNPDTWTPAQRNFYESLNPETKGTIWNNLPDQIEQVLGDRIEALAIPKAA